MSNLKHFDDDSYFDGVPEFIRKMTPEERDAYIEAETERLAIINKDIED